MTYTEWLDRMCRELEIPYYFLLPTRSKEIKICQALYAVEKREPENAE